MVEQMDTKPISTDLGSLEYLRQLLKAILFLGVIRVKDSIHVLKRIRANCLECCGGRAKEVKYCPVTTCELWLLRFGHKPSAAIKIMGRNADALLDKSNFEEGGEFGAEKLTSELGR